MALFKPPAVTALIILSASSWLLRSDAYIRLRALCWGVNAAAKFSCASSTALSMTPLDSTSLRLAASFRNPNNDTAQHPGLLLRSRQDRFDAPDLW